MFIREFLFAYTSENDCFTKVLEVFSFLILGPGYIGQDPKFISNMN